MLTYLNFDHCLCSVITVPLRRTLFSVCYDKLLNVSIFTELSTGKGESTRDICGRPRVGARRHHVADLGSATQRHAAVDSAGI